MEISKDGKYLELMNKIYAYNKIQNDEYFLLYWCVSSFYFFTLISGEVLLGIGVSYFFGGVLMLFSGQIKVWQNVVKKMNCLSVSPSRDGTSYGFMYFLNGEILWTDEKKDKKSMDLTFELSNQFFVYNGIIVKGQRY